jgi:lipoprotein-anchoring transpeptidase ErfK/SrfK
MTGKLLIKMVIWSFLIVLFAPAGTSSADSAQGFLKSLFDGRSTDSGRTNRSGRRVVSFTTEYRPGTIIVSFGDRRLYYISSRGKAISYPIGVPTGDARWSGTSHVSMKKVNPGWTPTASMRREDPDLPAHVPGGHPRNPLGVRALYLGDTLYRIHGTDAPWTIGNEVSRGCIRLYNKDVIDLYQRVQTGARVIVTSKRFKT